VGLRFGVVPSPEWKVGEWEVGGEPEGFGKCQGACELFFFLEIASGCELGRKAAMVGKRKAAMVGRPRQFSPHVSPCSAHASRGVRPVGRRQGSRAL
jgi:hypothetical protein